LTHSYGQASAQRTQHEREASILANLGLVRHILARLKARLPPGIDLENLEAAGVLGLVEAANRFEPRRGVRFETFAYPRIRGAILDELRRNCPLPQDLLERIARVRRVYRTLPPPVSVESLVAGTGLSEAEVIECLSALRLTRAGSWEDLAAAGGGLASRGQDQPAQQAELAEEKRVLTEGILRLPERERLVVTLYYMEDLRLKEIGVLLGLSESRVSRLLKTALFDLSEYMRREVDAPPAEGTDDELDASRP
jgi:RNA polymerase sigma factor for flagellar operon FliA